jgi:hypothetical protein
VDGLLDAAAYEAVARADDEEDEVTSTLANPVLV